MQTENSTTVSLVLGAGGARGYAHIGVIEWLAENGYAIRSIAGSSMGALVGGLYAAGKLDAYTDWALTLERKDVARLLDPSFGQLGLFRGERIMEIVRSLIGDDEIEDLPVSFTAIATELKSDKEVWLRSGRLLDAIRASIAVPLFLTPFEKDNRQLFDGGLVNPVPIAPTLYDTTDLTIAVNLNSCSAPAAAASSNNLLPNGEANLRHVRTLNGNLPAAPDKSAPGLLDIALNSIETMQNTIANLKLAAYSPDVTIDIPRNACRVYEFWRAEEMIALGRERAAQAFAARVVGTGKIQDRIRFRKSSSS